MDLTHIPTSELERELSKRLDKRVKYCPKCNGKWPIYEGASRSWNIEPHCEGCRKPIENCTC